MLNLHLKWNEFSSDFQKKMSVKSFFFHYQIPENFLYSNVAFAFRVRLKEIRSTFDVLVFHIKHANIHFIKWNSF